MVEKTTFRDLYELHVTIHNFHQKSVDLATYEASLKKLWEKQKTFEQITGCSCGHEADWSKIYEIRRIFQFLSGLHESYSELRNHILSMDNLPNLSEIFKLLSRSQSHQGAPISDLGSNSSGFILDKPSSPSPAAAHDPWKRPLNLLPGYYFAPKDTDIITHFLEPYLRGNTVPSFIHHVDIYKSNPQTLSEEYEKATDNEWFFLTERTSKGKAGGKNISRCDNAGFWRRTVQTVRIETKSGLVGYKNPLEYYLGKPPHGIKFKWLMVEYSLENFDDVFCKIYPSPANQRKKKEETASGKKKKEETASGKKKRKAEEEANHSGTNLNHPPRFLQQEPSQFQQMYDFAPQPYQFQYTQQQLPYQLQDTQQQLPYQFQDTQQQLPYQFQHTQPQLPYQFQDTQQQLPYQLQDTQQQLPYQFQDTQQQLPYQFQHTQPQQLCDFAPQLHPSFSQPSQQQLPSSSHHLPQQHPQPSHHGTLSQQFPFSDQYGFHSEQPSQFHLPQHPQQQLYGFSTDVPQPPEEPLTQQPIHPSFDDDDFFKMYKDLIDP